MTGSALLSWRAPLVELSKGSIRPKGMGLPQPLGTMLNPDLFFAVSNAALKGTEHVGTPVTYMPAGTMFERYVASSSPYNSFAAQWRLPPVVLNPKPSDRYTPSIALVAQLFGVTAAQLSITTQQSRYFATSIFGIRDERVKYALKDESFLRMWRMKDAVIDRSLAMQTFGDLTVYEFEYADSTPALDCTSNSKEFQELSRYISLDPLVKKVLDASPYNSLIEALRSSADHSAAQGLALGLRLADPDIPVLLYDSAQGRGGQSRPQAACFGDPGDTVSGLIPMVRRHFSVSNGRVEMVVEAGPSTGPVIQLGDGSAPKTEEE